jgi:hypothetical protein
MDFLSPTGALDKNAARRTLKESLVAALRDLSSSESQPSASPLAAPPALPSSQALPSHQMVPSSNKDTVLDNRLGLPTAAMKQAIRLALPFRQSSFWGGIYRLRLLRQRVPPD